MKQTIITILLALVAVAGQAKDIVIKRPAFRSISSNSLCPKKVDLTKNATVVHFSMMCAHWRDWSMDGARLMCNGQQFAFKEGRIITHDGTKVLADETFELGKQYIKNAQQDSVILYFEPLPRGAKTFDYIENDKEGTWKVYGIRLDNQLYPFTFPPYKKPIDNGEPLKPLTLKNGEATGTLTLHGGGEYYYFGEPSRDPITGQYESKSQYKDSTLVYCHPACIATRPVFGGTLVDDGMSFDFCQFPLILIPGETFTLESAAAACLARCYDFLAGKPDLHDCYRVVGTLGDLNQVLLENEFLHYRYIDGTPAYAGQDIPLWCDALWQSLDTLRQGVVQRRGYTHRQQDFLRLLLEDYYVRTIQEHTLTDPHAKDLMLFRDGRSYYLPLKSERLPYLEANGLDHGEVYEMLKGFVEAKKVGEKMRQGEVQADSVILAAHPYFQPVLRAFNDTTRVLLERLRFQAKDRMMPTPDVPGNQLLQTIANQHSGKAVFFDFWATWCGPCMKGIQAMESMKKELKERDVVFVYLTNESSPIDQWSEQIVRIPGLHYRIPNALWSEIPDLDAIPQYYLYDRQGNKVWEQTGFSDKVLEDIEKELEKIFGE